MRPVVAVTFGDASGIGPELVARLLARPDAVAAAQIVVVGDAWVLQDGQRVAGITTPLKVIHDWKAARDGDGTPMFLEVETVAKDDVVVAQVTEAAGRGARPATVTVRAVKVTPPAGLHLLIIINSGASFSSRAAPPSPLMFD